MKGEFDGIGRFLYVAEQHRLISKSEMRCHNANKVRNARPCKANVESTTSADNLWRSFVKMDRQHIGRTEGFSVMSGSKRMLVQARVLARVMASRQQEEAHKSLKWDTFLVTIPLRTIPISESQRYKSRYIQWSIFQDNSGIP